MILDNSKTPKFSKRGCPSSFLVLAYARGEAGEEASPVLPVDGFGELGGEGAGDGGGGGPVLEAEAEEGDDGLELDVAYARVDEVLEADEEVGVVAVGLHPVAVAAVGLTDPGPVADEVGSPPPSVGEPGAPRAMAPAPEVWPPKADRCNSAQAADRGCRMGQFFPSCSGVQSPRDL